MQTHSRPLEAQMATRHIFIGCWSFWSKIYWKRTCISPHRINQEIFPCGCWLDQWPVLWNQTRLELLSSNKRWTLHAKVCPPIPPWIPTPISKNTPTRTTKMVMPKLWIKNTMVQRVKLSRDPTIKKKKTNPKSGGEISILWPGSRPNITSGTWVNRSRATKRNNTNRG